MESPPPENPPADRSWRFVAPLMPLAPMARFLGVKPVWLRGEAEAGRVPNVPAGDTFLFNPPAVERALVERAAEPIKVEGASA